MNVHGALQDLVSTPAGCMDDAGESRRFFKA